MRRIALDAATWQSADDAFNALLAALEAPDWHGRNFNALWDTLTEAARYEDLDTFINGVQPPFRIEMHNVAEAIPEVQKFLADIAELFADARKEYAVDATITIEPSA
jgi:RNAse (barnase) inhibitor barstar